MVSSLFLLFMQIRMSCFLLLLHMFWTSAVLAGNVDYGSAVFESNRGKKLGTIGSWTYGSYGSNKGSVVPGSGAPVKVLYLPVTLGKKQSKKTNSDGQTSNGETQGYPSYNKHTSYSKWSAKKTPWSGSKENYGWSTYAGKEGTSPGWVGLNQGSSKGKADNTWTTANGGYGTSNLGWKAGWSKPKDDSGVIILRDSKKNSDSSSDGTQTQGDLGDLSVYGKQFGKKTWHGSKAPKIGGSGWGNTDYRKGWTGYNQGVHGNNGGSKNGDYSGYGKWVRYQSPESDVWNGQWSNGSDGKSGSNSGTDDVSDDSTSNGDDDESDNSGNDNDDGNSKGQGGSFTIAFGSGNKKGKYDLKLADILAKIAENSGSKTSSANGKSSGKASQSKTIIPILISIPTTSKMDDSDESADISTGTYYKAKRSNRNKGYKSTGSKTHSR